MFICFNPLTPFLRIHFKEIINRRGKKAFFNRDVCDSRAIKNIMAYHKSLRYYVTITMIIRKMWKEHIMASEKQTMLKYVNPISTTSKYSFLYKQHEKMFSNFL